jgi:hypothetical protein
MSDVITTEVRVCTGETVNVEALKIADIIKAGIACTDEQTAILAQAICDAYKAGKDYTAEQVGKVATFAVATDSKVTDLQDTIKEIEPAIELLKSVDATSLEKLTAIQEILSNDNIALQSLLSLKLDVASIKDSISDLKKVVNTNTTDIVKNTADIAELKAGQQSDVLCKVSDAFSNLSENLKQIFDCDARKAKLTDALGCITTPYTPVGEYQWAANPADLMTAPAMTAPVETVLPTETVVTEPVVEAMPEVVTEPVVIAEVIAPTPVVEPTYVVTSETIDGVLFEVLSDGNMRKTDVDGTVTTTNSMGDLVE